MGVDLKVRAEDVVKEMEAVAQDAVDRVQRSKGRLLAELEMATKLRASEDFPDSIADADIAGVLDFEIPAASYYSGEMPLHLNLAGMPLGTVVVKRTPKAGRYRALILIERRDDNGNGDR